MVAVVFEVFFAAAVQIALPLIAVLFIADLGLALLTKVAPQLNAIGIMFPAKIGLTLLSWACPSRCSRTRLSGWCDAANDAMAALG